MPYKTEDINICSAVRLSKKIFQGGSCSLALDLPVSDSDGLSKIVCLSCIKKIESIEVFRLLARRSYQKQVSKEQLPSSPVRSAPKKRTKDTSGSDASPFTVSSRPTAHPVISRTSTITFLITSVTVAVAANIGAPGGANALSSPRCAYRQDESQSSYRTYIIITTGVINNLPLVNTVCFVHSYCH